MAYPQTPLAAACMHTMVHKQSFWASYATGSFVVHTLRICILLAHIMRIHTLCIINQYESYFVHNVLMLSQGLKVKISGK